jgi:hypothetical protein
VSGASFLRMQIVGARALLLAIAVGAAALALFADSALAEDTIVLPPEFEATDVGDPSALAKPTAVAFAPDGRAFVLDEGYAATKNGPQVRVEEPGTSVFTPLFKFGHVNIKQDRGLVGMALEREFDAPGHNYMYLLYTYEPGVGPSESIEARTERLTRVEVPATAPAQPIEPTEEVILGKVGTTVSATQACPYPKTAGGELDPKGDWTPYEDVDCIPDDSTEHAVDSVAVDPSDGTLWVSIGDGAAGDSSPDPLAYRAQAIDSLAGKLLHVDRNGHGLPTNGTCPGVSDFNRNCTKVFARGLRNPFRFSFRSDKKLAVGDVGWETREEIDLLSVSAGGKDLGWPCYEGSVQTPLWKDRPECKAFYESATPLQGPAYEYSGSGGAAVILGPTYEGTGTASDYPDQYKEGLFFSDYVSKKVSYLKFDSGGLLTGGYPMPFGELPDAVDWALAPNGDLVYVDIGFAGDKKPSIREISAVENHRPVAKIQLSGPPYGNVPLKEEFKGSGSSDPDPGETETLSYAWDLNGDGEFDDSTEADPPLQEYADGSHNVTVKLKVTDTHEKSGIASVKLFPGDHPPQITMDSGNPTMYRGDEKIELKGTGSDPDLGEATTLHWQARINHNNTHFHDLNPGEGNTFTLETDHEHDQPSTYEVIVYAEDERELKTELPTIVLKPETAMLQLTSTPSGAVVTYKKGEHVTPFTGLSTIGVQVGISAVESFFSGGVEYRFASWSNGGLRSQTVTMPEGGLSLNANYVTASGQPTPGGKTSDVFPARLVFSPKRGLVNHRKAMLRGTATDPSGVRKVQVALRQAQKTGGRCRWWSQRKGGFPTGASSCGHLAYMIAKLNGSGERFSWVLALGGHLPAGRYLLHFRTEDGAGNVGAGPNGSKPVPLRVK